MKFVLPETGSVFDAFASFLEAEQLYDKICGTKNGFVEFVHGYISEGDRLDFSQTDMRNVLAKFSFLAHWDLFLKEEDRTSNCVCYGFMANNNMWYFFFTESANDESIKRILGKIAGAAIDVAIAPNQ